MWTPDDPEHHRHRSNEGLCTMDVLADLLGVCRSSIGNAIRETRPLLEQAGHTSTPAPTRYRTAAVTAR
jgi:hypothetical protein